MLRSVSVFCVVFGLGLVAFGRWLDDLDSESTDIAGVCMFLGACLVVGSLVLLLYESQFSQPSPLESPEQRQKRLKAKARELLVLEFCHQVLSERIKTDVNQAHLWQLEDKVATGMLRYLHDLLPAEFRNPQPPLSAAETEQILEEHPLLHLSFAEPPDGTNVREHIQQIRSKLLKYLEAKDTGSTKENKSSAQMEYDTGAER